MNYVSIREISKEWGIDPSRIGRLAREGRIPGAIIVGKSWLIPETAEKPTDKRIKNAKADGSNEFFRFPLYINREKKYYVPSLTEDEAATRIAQIDYFAGNFEKAKEKFEYLSVNAENVYLKINATFFMCLLAAFYDSDIDWNRYFCSLNLLITDELPHKPDMEIYVAWLYSFLLQAKNVNRFLNYKVEYEYSTDALPLISFLSFFKTTDSPRETFSKNNLCLYEVICKQTERQGYFYEAHELHYLLFLSYYTISEKEEMYFHLKKALALSYKYDLITVTAAYGAYYKEEFDAVLKDYPAEFGEKIRRLSKSIYENYSIFTAKNSILNIYSSLSQSDIRYVIYALNGYTYKQISKIVNRSEHTVASRYSEMFSKLNVGNRREFSELLKKIFNY